MWWWFTIVWCIFTFKYGDKLLVSFISSQENLNPDCSSIANEKSFLYLFKSMISGRNQSAPKYNVAKDTTPIKTPKDMR